MKVPLGCQWTRPVFAVAVWPCSDHECSPPFNVDHKVSIAVGRQTVCFCDTVGKKSVARLFRINGLARDRAQLIEKILCCTYLILTVRLTLHFSLSVHLTAKVSATWSPAQLKSEQPHQRGMVKRALARSVLAQWDAEGRAHLHPYLTSSCVEDGGSKMKGRSWCYEKYPDITLGGAARVKEVADKLEKQIPRDPAMGDPS